MTLYYQTRPVPRRDLMGKDRWPSHYLLSDGSGEAGANSGRFVIWRCSVYTREALRGSRSAGQSSIQEKALFRRGVMCTKGTLSISKIICR